MTWQQQKYNPRLRNSIRRYRRSTCRPILLDKKMRKLKSKGAFAFLDLAANHSLNTIQKQTAAKSIREERLVVSLSIFTQFSILKNKYRQNAIYTKTEQRLKDWYKCIHHESVGDRLITWQILRTMFRMRCTCDELLLNGFPLFLRAVASWAIDEEPRYLTLRVSSSHKCSVGLRSASFPANRSLWMLTFLGIVERSD